MEYKKLDDIIEFNPTETLQKGTLSKKISMDKLGNFSKNITSFEYEEYGGGMKFRNGDTLLARITPCLENGKTSKVTILDENEVGFGSTEYIVMRSKKNISDEDFIFYLAISPKFREIAIKSMNGTSGRQRVQLDVVKNTEMLIPNYEEQTKIGKILSSIDKKIELNTQINDNLQSLLNKIFTKWFCEYDYPNESNQPYKSSGGKMIESELGEIPENWRIGLFQDVIDFSNGYGFKSNDLLDNEEKETYKVFKQGNINLSGGINEKKTKSWFYKEKAKGLEKFILQKGDILMCMTDMKNSTSPLLGHTALMNVNDEYIVNQRVGLIRCKKEITDYPYVYTMSNLEYFLKDIRSRANSGVQVNLSTKGICETKIIIPDKRVLNKYNEFAIPLYEMMFRNQKENQDLEKLRDTLLPKLMNGEIDLNRIEI
ncbi:MAG: restriction endonuclease subunit S [Clostridia bacterium]|nr:restriction endonuclease subunit S [Clostridia bacterium]